MAKAPPTAKDVESWCKAIEDGINGEDFKDRFGRQIGNARVLAKKMGVVLPHAHPGIGTGTDEARAALTRNSAPALTSYWPGNRQQRAARKTRPPGR